MASASPDCARKHKQLFINLVRRYIHVVYQTLTTGKRFNEGFQWFAIGIAGSISFWAAFVRNGRFDFLDGGVGLVAVSVGQGTAGEKSGQEGHRCFQHTRSNTV